MSALQVPISDEDRDRIEQMCAQYRSQIENLYNVAYLQGSIAQVEEDRARLKAELKGAA